MQLSNIDLIIVALYAISLIVIATMVSREKKGKLKDSKDYFLASKALPWWAIGASLIAANISAEQIIGMTGSGYVVGLAIASYEWLAAFTLIIVGKYALPIFLKRQIYTMPQFLEQRFNSTVKYVMSVFWVGIYTFINLTTIIWMGAIALNILTGLEMYISMWILALFTIAYSLFGGLKAVALTDMIQVVMLVIGGVILTVISLNAVGNGDFFAGIMTLFEKTPERFDVILSRDNPEYKNLPGIGVILGGMWVMHFSYWGFNQYIIQRALAAKDIHEARKGIALAAMIKIFMPLIIVVPGIAAALLFPGLEKNDQAYPQLMTLMPVGMKGLIFAALIAAIVSSLGSMMNSISTIVTMDLYKPLMGKNASEHKLVTIGRIAAVVAIIIAIHVAKPLYSQADQLFQAIQEYTGFFTPGIVVMFVLGLFFRKASSVSALVAIFTSLIASILFKTQLAEVPFIDRVGMVFVLSLLLGLVSSYFFPRAKEEMEKDKNSKIDKNDFVTKKTFNIFAILVTVMLVIIYAVFW